MDKVIERISCCGTETNTPLQIFTFVEKYKQFVNGVLFDLKDSVTILLCHPLKIVLNGEHAPTPSRQHTTAETGLIEHLSELRSLITQVPNICSFQGLIGCNLTTSILLVVAPPHLVYRANTSRVLNL